MAKKQKQNPNDIKNAAAKRLQFTMLSRLGKALQKEFTLQDIFKLGYRNKEDISNQPPYVLSVGSQNVLTNAAEQIVVRNGYQYDGPVGNQNTYGIDSGYDFNTHVNGVQNVRKWGTNLEMRYVNPSTKVVSWINILNSLLATNVCNFTDFWEVSNTKNVCLFVNGTLSVYRWTGAIGSFASSTSNTITLQGSKSLPNLNFDTSGSVLIDGVTYVYTSAGFIAAIPYTESPTNNKIPVTQTQWTSQLFTTGSAATQITSVALTTNQNIIETLSVNYLGSIYTDNAGVPGTLVASTIGSVPGVSSSGNFIVNFTFNASINPSTNYHFVVSLLAGVGTLSVYTGVSSGVGTNISVNSGVSWSSQNGFLNMVVNENDSNLQTFNGVSPSPSGITVGDAVIQAPTVGTTAVTDAPLSTFDLIGTLRNQIYYGSFSNQTVYITKVNSYTDASFSTPRVVGEGASVTLDAPPVAFIPQVQAMYMSAGLSYWYGTKFTLSSDLANESFEINAIKTSANQGAFSQSYVANIKNSISFISNEVLFNSFGPVKDILTDPQMENMSDPIKYDVDAYTFGGGSVHYFNYFIYFSVPKNNVVRVYNVDKKYWEAPQTMPVGIFYEVNGALYGHDATTNASYQLFVPNTYNDVGGPINAIAAFPYVSSEGAQANQKKFFNKFYTEGYIAGNTTLTLEINYDFGAFSGTYSTGISGANKAIVFNKITDGSLGKNTLGSQPIGTILNLPQLSPIPKFRVINTFAPVNNFEYQVVYSSYDVDQNWALLRFGPGIAPSRDIGNEIVE